MNLKLPNLDHLPPVERAEKLREIESFLLKIVYSEILPTMPLEKQIEVLRNLERLGANQYTPTGIPASIDDDPSMMSDVLAEVNEVLG